MSDTTDLRSDTVTRPTAAMKAAMMDAPLGDDVFGDDPTVNALEARVAGLLGKEAGIFVPSGTMSNQLAVRVHTRFGDEVVCHEGCHIHNWESGAPAALWGVTVRAVGSPDGTLPIVGLEAAIRAGEDPHVANTRLVCLENTHNAAGGVVLPQEHVLAVAAVARGRGLALHLDGARLMNAAVASGVEARALAEPFDTVSLCLSKGLGAPVGSVLAGAAPLVGAARRWRKMLGGGMRQAGVIAAAGLYALEHNVGRLADDHRRARAFAEAAAALPGLGVDLPRVQTNLVFMTVDPAHPMGKADGGSPALVERLRERGVLVSGRGQRVRAVFHLDVDDAGLDRAVEALRAAMG